MTDICAILIPIGLGFVVVFNILLMFVGNGLGW